MIILAVLLKVIRNLKDKIYSLKNIDKNYIEDKCSYYFNNQIQILKLEYITIHISKFKKIKKLFMVMGQLQIEYFFKLF